MVEEKPSRAAKAIATRASSGAERQFEDCLEKVIERLEELRDGGGFGRVQVTMKARRIVLIEKTEQDAYQA